MSGVVAILPAYNEEVSIESEMLADDMELRRPLYYFTLPGLLFAAVGIGMGLQFLRDFYHGGALHFGPTLLMIMLTIIGSFMALTGILLHSMSRLIRECRVG